MENSKLIFIKRKTAEMLQSAWVLFLFLLHHKSAMTDFSGYLGERQNETYSNPDPTKKVHLKILRYLLIRTKFGSAMISFLDKSIYPFKIDVVI